MNDVKNKTSIIRSKEVRVELPAKPIKYYRHGWQSWSLAAWTDLDPLPMQKPSIFLPLHVDIQHAYEPYPNGSWMGAVELEDGSVLLVGALATDAHVVFAENQLSGRSEAGEIEWFIHI